MSSTSNAGRGDWLCARTVLPERAACSGHHLAGRSRGNAAQLAYRCAGTLLSSIAVRPASCFTWDFTRSRLPWIAVASSRSSSSNLCNDNGRSPDTRSVIREDGLPIPLRPAGQDEIARIGFGGPHRRSAVPRAISAVNPLAAVRDVARLQLRFPRPARHALRALSADPAAFIVNLGTAGAPAARGVARCADLKPFHSETTV